MRRHSWLSLANGIQAIVAIVVGLGLATVLGVFGQSGRWPFVVPTTTSTSIVTFYSGDVAAQIVRHGCDAIETLSSSSIQDEQRGTPVTLSVPKTLEKIKMMEQAGSVLPQDSSLVAAAKVLIATLQQKALPWRWRAINNTVHALRRQCQLQVPQIGVDG